LPKKSNYITEFSNLKSQRREKMQDNKNYNLQIEITDLIDADFQEVSEEKLLETVGGLTIAGEPTEPTTEGRMLYIPVSSPKPFPRPFPRYFPRPKPRNPHDPVVPICSLDPNNNDGLPWCAVIL
jgi:hypothetical protein